MSQSPSTVDTGFILSPTLLENPVTSDRVFQRILECGYSIYRCTNDITDYLRASSAGSIVEDCPQLDQIRV